MSIKLDMSKAYNRVEQNCLESVMAALGFNQNFTHLVLQCVFNLLFDPHQWCSNRSHYSNSGTKTKRSTIPLSLSSMYQETNLLRSSREDIRVPGIRICRNAHVVNHLLFANDSIIFYKTEVETNKRVQKLLEIYGLSSSQLINTEKTTMVFNKNSLKAFKQEIVTLWQNGRCQQYEKYLGLPSFVGKAKYRAFSEIKIECGRN